MIKLAALTLCVWFMMASPASSVKCYQCSGADCRTGLAECSNPLSGVFGKTEACLKTVTGNLVTRACAPVAPTTGCTTVGSITTCFCKEDGCNGSTGVRASFIVVTTAVGLVLKQLLL